MMSGVPQVLSWDQCLYILNSDIGDAIKCNLSKSADDSKLSGESNMTEGRECFQMDLNKLKMWACDLQQGLRYVYRHGEKLLENNLAKTPFISGLGRCRSSYEPAMCTCCLKGQLYPGQHQKRGDSKARVVIVSSTLFL